jgi:hypothetical protein
MTGLQVVELPGLAGQLRHYLAHMQEAAHVPAGIDLPRPSSARALGRRAGVVFPPVTGSHGTWLGAGYVGIASEDLRVRDKPEPVPS